MRVTSVAGFLSSLKQDEGWTKRVIGQKELVKNPATLVESSVAGFLSSLKQDEGWTKRVIGQKELVKSASKPCHTRLFSAYIFLETVCLEENVRKHAVFLIRGFL